MRETVITRSIKWHHWNGGEESVSMGPYLIGLDDSAKPSLATWAIQAGWTPKKWWKWWRWLDHSYDYANEVWNERESHNAAPTQHETATPAEKQSCRII